MACGNVGALGASLMLRGDCILNQEKSKGDNRMSADYDGPSCKGRSFLQPQRRAVMS